MIKIYEKCNKSIKENILIINYTWKITTVPMEDMANNKKKTIYM